MTPVRSIVQFLEIAIIDIGANGLHTGNQAVKSVNVDLADARRFVGDDGVDIDNPTFPWRLHRRLHRQSHRPGGCWRP